MISPSYKNLRPRSSTTSEIAKASSRKADTRCEVIIRRAIWRLGLRYRLNARDLPGVPDIVFRKARVVVFVDGDFWHGRNLRRRLKRLRQGHNPDYWVQKIRRNVKRDKQTTANLEREGWLVLRFWETDVRSSALEISHRVKKTVSRRMM